jgi:hypothetical protein
MVADEAFVYHYGTQVKKVLFKVSYKTIQSRSHNSDLRRRGAGAERNIFGSTTLIKNIISLIEISLD